MDVRNSFAGADMNILQRWTGMMTLADADTLQRRRRWNFTDMYNGGRGGDVLLADMNAETRRRDATR